MTVNMTTVVKHVLWQRIMVKGKLFFILINSTQHPGVITKSEYKMTGRLITCFSETDIFLIVHEFNLYIALTTKTVYENIKYYNTYEYIRANQVVLSSF